MRLREIFPRYVDVPEGRPVLISIAYWFARLFLLPGLMGVLVLGFSPVDGGFDPSLFILMGFILLDLVVMCLIYREFLKDSLSTFRSEWKSCLKSIAIGLGIVTAANIVLFLCYGNVFPVADLLAQFPAFYFALHPLLGIVSLVILAPVATCCLFHATFFSRLCGERPWLAYPLVALILGLLFWFSDRELVNFPRDYLAVLPTHLCACWVYQKTRTIWSGIILVAIANLLVVLLYALFPMLAARALFGLVF